MESDDVPVVVYDASVLFPFHTAHLLTFAAMARVVRAHWTEEIKKEWLERSLERYPSLQRASVETRQRRMDLALPDALVENHQHRIDGIEFPDPDDRHVVAAALECRASLIVTRDKKHFNKKSLARFELEAIDPDVLPVEALERHPDLMAEVVDNARRALTKTEPGLPDYLASLETTGLNGFAQLMRGSFPMP